MIKGSLTQTLRPKIETTDDVLDHEDFIKRLRAKRNTCLNSAKRDCKPDTAAKLIEKAYQYQVMIEGFGGIVRINKKAREKAIKTSQGCA